MSHDDFELASEEEVLQEEVQHQAIAPVPVTVEGPVRTQQLPNQVYVSRTMLNVPSTVATLILSHEDRRSRAVLISIDQPMYVGRTPGEVESGIAAVWPDGVPYEVRSGQSVYAMCAAGGNTTTTISFHAEYWTR
jgi:hypothetical protein